VGGELLAVADERAEERMVVREELEADALGGVVDRDARLADASISSIVEGTATWATPAAV